MRMHEFRASGPPPNVRVDQCDLEVARGAGAWALVSWYHYDAYDFTRDRSTAYTWYICIRISIERSLDICAIDRYTALAIAAFAHECHACSQL